MANAPLTRDDVLLAIVDADEAVRAQGPPQSFRGTERRSGLLVRHSGLPEPRRIIVPIQHVEDLADERLLRLKRPRSGASGWVIDVTDAGRERAAQLRAAAEAVAAAAPPADRIPTAGELLVALADADAAARPERHRFLVSKTMGRGPGVGVAHPGLPSGFRCNEQDLHDLIDAGHLREHDDSRSLTFDVTQSGLARADRLRRAASAGGSATGGAIHPLSWDERALPVLEAVGRLSAAAPSDLGVSTEMVAHELPGFDRSSIARALDELMRAGYLEETMGSDQEVGPAWCRLREKGLQVTAGWPSGSGEVAVHRLLAIIDERLATAVGEERTKWERLRDGVTGIGRDVLVGVLTTTVNAAAKGTIE